MSIQQSYIDRMEQAFKHKKYFIDIIRALQMREDYSSLLEQVFTTTSSKHIQILDYGCGSGLLSYRMALTFPNSLVVAYDQSLEMIEIARERFVLPNLYFMSTTNTIPERSFDFVILSSLLHEVYSSTANILTVNVFLDNVARFVDDHGYIISRDNYVQPGEAKNTEFKFINHRALKVAVEFAKKLSALMPLSLKMAGDWNLIFDESTETITGPDRAVKEFLNKLTWGEESLHREAKEMLFFLSPDDWKQIMPAGFDVVGTYSYMDEDYLNYLRRYIIIDKKQSFLTHQWTILQRT